MQFPQAWDSTHSSQFSWHEACRNAPVPPSQDPPGFPPGSLKTGTAKALDCTGCTDGWVLNTSPALCPLPAKLEGPRHLVVNNWAPSSLFTYLLATKSSRFQTRQAQFICLRSQSRGKRFPDSHTITAALRRNTRTSWN